MVAQAFSLCACTGKMPAPPEIFLNRLDKQRHRPVFHPQGIRPCATGGLQGQGYLRIMAATGPQILQVFKRDNPLETEKLPGLIGKNGSDVQLSSPTRLICQPITTPY